MGAKPKIVVSSLDCQRLESLLDALPKLSPEHEALQQELARAEIREPAKMPPSVVTMNSTVAFVIEDTGERFELTLRYPSEAGQPGTVSIMAPIGSALLGLAIGKSIDWPVPGGKMRQIRVVDIAYQPERAGDYTR